MQKNDEGGLQNFKRRSDIKTAAVATLNKKDMPDLFRCYLFFMLPI
jgi:hypothetical protein